MKTEESVTIIWDRLKNIPLPEFLKDARAIKCDYVLYVIDAEGELDSVWACPKKEFTECMFALSDKCYFARVQSIADAIQYGFYDEVKNN